MDTYIVRRHLKIYATEGVYAVSEKRASFLLRPVPPPFLRPRPPVSSGSKTVSSRLPTAFNFPGGRLMTRPVTNKPRLLAPRRCLRLALDNLGPLFFVVRIIAYRTKLGLDSDRLVLHRERLGIRLRTIMFPRPGSFLRIEFQPDHEPAILLPRFANNTANRRRRKEREREREREKEGSLVFDLHAKGYNNRIPDRDRSFSRFLRSDNTDERGRSETRKTRQSQRDRGVCRNRAMFSMPRARYADMKD